MKTNNNKINSEELDLLNKLANETNQSNWFRVIQPFAFFKFIKNKQSDFIYDLNQRKSYELKEGIELLFDRITRYYTNFIELNDKELEILLNMKKRFNITLSINFLSLINKEYLFKKFIFDLICFSFIDSLKLPKEDLSNNLIERIFKRATDPLNPVCNISLLEKIINEEYNLERNKLNE